MGKVEPPSTLPRETPTSGAFFMSMKKDAYYFPHFSNARNDVKLLRLRRVLGLEGYGIYFCLLEILRDQTDFRYPIAGLAELEFELRVPKEKISTVIMDYDLFTVDSTGFFSPKLIQYLMPYLEKSERAREAANKRWNDAKALQKNMQGEEKRGEESKENESKGEEIKSAAAFDAGKPATLDQRRSDFMKKVADAGLQKYDKEMLREFYEYWIEMNEGGRKMRFEMQKVFDIGRRLATWNKNNKNFGKNGITEKRQQQSADLVHGFASRVIQRAQNGEL